MQHRYRAQHEPGEYLTDTTWTLVNPKEEDLSRGGGTTESFAIAALRQPYRANHIWNVQTLRVRWRFASFESVQGAIINKTGEPEPEISTGSHDF